MKNKSCVLLLSMFMLFVSFSVSSNQFQVLDVDFALSCGIDDPVFPDINVTRRVPGGVFEDGVYAGSIPSNGLTPVFSYFELNYFDEPINNFTLPVSPFASGEALSPPSFDLVNLKADLSSLFFEWNGIVNSMGRSDLDIVDNMDGAYTLDYVVDFVADSKSDGCKGRLKLVLECFTCEISFEGLSAELSASQNEGPVTRTVLTTGGRVVIVSDKGVSPPGVAFNWVSNSSIVSDIDSDAGTFTFDPANLTPGNYIFTMIYKDNNLGVPVQLSSEIVLKVVENLDGDSDDDDNDGISNKYDDEILLDNQLQLLLENNSSPVITSSTGKLKTGKTAFCAGKASFITESDLENFGSATCTPVTNSVDSNVENSVVGGYFDFEIHGLNVGEQVQVVLPLTSGMPSNASYRKYISNIGWEKFYVRGDDAVSSSPGPGSGICPSPDSNTYTSGLTQGDTCVRLSITDGGPNDADFTANGVIIDPGTVAVDQSSLNSSSGCSLSLGSNSEKMLDHLEWLLVLFFLLRIFYICRYNKG